MHPFEAGVNKKYTGIEIRLDGERVGELTKASAEKVAPIVQLWEENGYATAARAYIQGSSLAIDLKLQYTPASEMTEEDLDPELCPIPKLVPFEPDPDDYVVPDAWPGTAKPAHQESAQVRMAFAEKPRSASSEAPNEEQSWFEKGSTDNFDAIRNVKDEPQENLIGHHNEALASDGSSALNFERSLKSTPTSQSPAHTHQAPPPSRTSVNYVKILKYVLAGLVGIVGLPFFLVGLFDVQPPMFLFSIPFILPPVWFFFNEWRDTSGVPHKRYWTVIAAISSAALIAAMWIPEDPM